jgi:hypothetical protein
VAEGKGTRGGEGLSLQTLVLAAVSSAAAAIIVSHLWKGGTVVAAAMTPVFVAITKELLAKPMESELVRKPVSKIASGSRAALGSTPVVGRRGSSPGAQRQAGDPARARAATRGTGDPLTTGTSMPPTERRGPQLDPSPGNGGPPETQLTPMRTYGSPRRRPLHLKVAIVTGLVGFAIAAAALTLPELLFGGAVSSHHSTTLFGGGSGKSKSDKQKNQDQGTTTQPDQQKPGNQQTTTTPAPNSQTPTTTTPAPTTPQQQPQQTTPQQTSPVPPAPTPPTP